MNQFSVQNHGKTQPFPGPLLEGLGGDHHLRRGGCQQRRRAALRGVRLVGDACLGFLGLTGYGGDGESMVDNNGYSLVNSNLWLIYG